MSRSEPLQPGAKPASLRSKLKARLERLLSELHTGGSNLHTPLYRGHDQGWKVARELTLELRQPWVPPGWGITPPDHSEAIDPQQDALRLPATVGEALNVVSSEAHRLVELTATEIECAAALLIEDQTLRNAIMTRRAVIDRWPWPSHIADTQHRSCGGHILELLQRVITRIEDFVVWPGEAAPMDVARWVQNPLNRAVPYRKGSFRGLGDALVFMAKNYGMMTEMYPAQTHEDLEAHVGAKPETDVISKPLVIDGAPVRFPPAGLALLFLTAEQVDADRKRPAIQIDAGADHHRLLVGWRSMPEEGVIDDIWKNGNYIELLPPTAERGLGVQLALPLPLGGALHDATIRALTKLRGWEGLRHWAGILRLLAVEGGRQGWVRWTMQDHLNALGFSKRIREDPTRLAEIATEVELLTQLELAVYSQTGEERARGPLLHVGTKYDRLKDSRYQLDGMELRINPMLYSGVRNTETGKLGRKSFPAPVDLARIDHRNKPHALALGLLLPIRWRWALWQERDHVAISGANLLDLGGINQERLPRAWTRLENALDELKRIDQLDHAEWDGSPFQMTTICRLYPAEWSVERACLGVIPVERPAADVPRTGRDLRQWRAERGWSQREASRHLHVSQPTVSRAEQSPDESLSRRLIAAFERWTR